ncbi:MAG: lysophospholipid acyltransferase family protein [Gemmatimonadaceae bacterium]
MRTVLAFLMLVVATPILATAVIVAGLLGVRDVPGGIYDWAPRVWARLLLWASGVRVVLHHPERAPRNSARIYVANHVSWFDVFTLAAVLRRYRWVGKAELFRIPLFGRAARAAGMIPIDRDNLKAAFESYDVAGERIRSGASVVVCPEGTRGETYALRPFKKGPFVLAAKAGVPIVPTLLYGTIHVFPRGSWRVRSGVVHVHFLEEIPTSDTSYLERDALAKACWARMASALEREYGIASLPDSASVATSSSTHPSPRPSRHVRDS